MKRRQFMQCLLASTVAPSAFRASAATTEDTIFMYNPLRRLKHDDAFEEYLKIHRPNARFFWQKIDLDNEAAMRDVIADIRKRRPSLIYTWGTLATMRIAGKIEDVENGRGDHISDIPIVFVSVTQPAAVGIVRDLQHPRRNVTGVSHIVPIHMQLKAIREYRAFTKLGMVYNPLEPNSIWVRDRLLSMAPKEGFTLSAYPVPLDANKKLQPEGIPALLKTLKSEGAQWLYLGPDAYVAGAQRKVVVDVYATTLDCLFLRSLKVPCLKVRRFSVYSSNTNIWAPMLRKRRS
jgi:putative tryptophan/tyrosine transport system substrate-binding protein